MKRRNLTPAQNAENLDFNMQYGLHHAILRTESVVDEFYFEECNPSDDDMKSVSICDPIIMLFNQERLDNMGASAVKNFLDSLAPQSSDLVELRKQCSDEDLMSMMKSRHLQSPAEILHWCRYMQQNVDQFNSEVARLQAQAEVEKAQKNVETKVETLEA